MNETTNSEPSLWFAIKTKNEYQAAEVLAELCDEVYFPVESVKTPSGALREKAVIPRVLFIKTTVGKALSLEGECRTGSRPAPPFWIYRNPKSDKIQPIVQKSIDLFRLLTSSDTSSCSIYTAEDFTVDQRVRITGGPYQGYEGFVKRIKKNRHVIVEIEGLCMVILPFIHPDLLERI